MMLGKLDSHIQKKMNLDPYLTSLSKINLRDLTIGPETIVLLGEIMGEKLWVFNVTCQSYLSS